MSSESSFLTLLDQWLDSLSQQGKSPQTIAAYRRALARFAQWSQRVYGEPPVVRALIPRDIRDWKAAQQIIDKAAPATINQRLVALTRFCQWAIAHGFLATDPTITIPAIRLPARQPKAMSSKAVRRLLRLVHSAGNLRDIALIELLVGTGIRVSECLALQRGDLRIRERSGSLTVRSGKGGGYRVVPLTADVRVALLTYLETLPPGAAPDTSLWDGPYGGLSHRSTVLRLLHKYTTVAGLPAIGPHVLRHTFATRYLSANPGDLRGLAALLGHATLDTVLIYTEPTLDDLALRMERIDQLPANDE